VIHRPKFKSHLRAEFLAPDALLIFNENECRSFQGKFLHAVASQIDGKSTSAEIKQRLKKRFSESDVDAGLLLLEAEGLITDASQSLPAGIAALCDFLGVDAHSAERRLKKARVSITSFGDIDAESLIQSLTVLGIQTAEKGNFAVALVDDYLMEDLSEWNRNKIRMRQKWMIARPTGSMFWIGPVFRSPQTACWRCLALRLKDNRRAERLIDAGKRKKTIPGVTSTLPTTFQAAMNLIASEILRHIVGSPETELVTFDIRQMKMERHTVIRLDHCPDCQAGRAKAKPLHLKSRKKIYTPPELTFSKYRHHISPITGIVDSVVPYSSNQNGVIHSFIAGHIFIPRLKKEDVFQRGFVQQSGGKGMSAQRAKTSALCEALERYSGVFRGNEPRSSASAKDVGDTAVLPNSCMNFSERQYAIRKAWNRTHHNHDWIPEPLDQKKKVEWSPVWSLTQQKTRYVPTAYCYYGYPLPPDHQFCRADSNGNAAGNSIEEAVVNGFLELVERDATAIWWFNRIRRPAVDLNSFSIPYIKDLRQHYWKANREFWVFDITADFPIPVFVALSSTRKNHRTQFLVGFGAHFDPAVALTRALAEMNQFFPAISSSNTSAVLQPAGDPGFLLPDAEMFSRKFSDYREYDSDDVSKDIRMCVKLAAERGMETLVLDQTRRDVALPVVKVIVPGMRQFWPRFGRGRLYDVPVQLGWLKNPLKESRLNQDRIVI
jgi:bacteriocin biosynthesis cyclodehydratase domain-containing protein